MAHQALQDCIDASDRCATACEHCATACLQEDNVQMLARCIALNIDCAQMCRIASAFMARDSEFAEAICGLCAQICEACAEECERHDMPHCRECAEACRRCAQECRRMLSAALSGSSKSHSATAAHQ